MKARLREYAAVWDGLWSINRRRVLNELFASMTWHRRPERLEVVLSEQV
ncbi:hypothetical protein ACMHYB_09765 [Sorangium sp. So ce1128]